MYPIPANATRIRYLESTGTQYIDTGVVPNGETGIDCDFAMLNVTKNFSPVFWSRGSSATDRAFCFEGEYAGDAKCQARWDYGNYGAKQVRNVIEQGARTTASVRSGTLTVDTTTLVRNEQTFTGAGSIILFNFCNYINGERQMLSAACQPIRIYGFTIYDGSTIVRSFVPIRIGSVGYLFDRASGQLFGNAGTGDFTLGPDTFQQGVVPTRMMVGGVRKKYKELPDGYTAVDWLDTGFTGTANRGAYFISTNNLSLAENTTKIVANYVCVNNIGEWNVLYTNQTSDNQSGSLCTRKAGTGLSGFVGDDSIRSTIVYNQPGVAVVDAGSFYVDDVLIGSKASPGTNILTQKFIIGNVTWQTSSRRIWPGLIGRISVYSSGVLVANYVPCQEVATSKYGFYDTISKNFGASQNASYPFIPATI